MSEDSFLEFHGREARLDPLTKMLSKRAQDLSGQAMGAELAELLATMRIAARMREKWLLPAMKTNRNASCKRNPI